MIEPIMNSGNNINTRADILFLIPNYYNESTTLNFIRNELLVQTYKNIQIIVIDNGSMENSPFSNEISKLENVKVLSYGENLGYLGAAKSGLEFFVEKSKKVPEMVILSNSDIHLIGNTFLEKLIDMHKQYDFDILGPDLYSSFVKYSQNPYMVKRIKKSKLFFFYVITKHYILYNFFLIFYYFKEMLFSNFKNKGIKTYKSIYSVHGAFVIFSKMFFLKGGHFNYNSFLFGEEIFFGEIAYKKKMKVAFSSELKVVHDEYSTTGIFKSKRIIGYMHNSYKYLINVYSQNNNCL